MIGRMYLVPSIAKACRERDITYTEEKLKTVNGETQKKLLVAAEAGLWEFFETCWSVSFLDWKLETVLKLSSPWSWNGVHHDC